MVGRKKGIRTKRASHASEAIPLLMLPFSFSNPNLIQGKVHYLIIPMN